jgi:hypothetical protein
MRDQQEARLRRHVEAQLAEIARRRSAAEPARGGRNLVLGLTAGYGEVELAPFVESLRAIGYQGDVAFVTFDTSPETSAYLASHDVREVAFDSMPFLEMSMNSARMLKYLEFLRTAGFAADGVPAYDYVMLADVRDVVFQGDPFARADGADIYYFLESGRTFGTCPVNAAWMEMAFGAAALRRVAGARISCAGTLIARPLALMEYLLHMALCIARTHPVVRRSGIDQAIHNHLMIEGTIANARIVENAGPVMTVPTGIPHGMTVSTDGALRNADGSLSETVHQYDRDPVLLAAVKARYGR